jgi:hypothetical protein
MIDSSGKGYAHFMTSLLLVVDQGKIAFDILVPISATSLFAWLLLYYVPGGLLLHTALALISVFASIEIFQVFNYYSVKLLLVGLLGVLLGRAIIHYDWAFFLRSMQDRRVLRILIPFLILYYVFAVYQFHYYNFMSLHVLPITLALFSAYFCSYHFSLMEKSVLQSLVSTLSQNLLLAYFFHIALLRFLLIFMDVEGFSLLQASIFSLFVLGATLLICTASSRFSAKSDVYRYSYGLFFKL